MSEAYSSGNDDWGTISIDGQRRSCKKFDIKLSEDGLELQYMISETDKDGNDGLVNKEKFMCNMENAVWF